MSPPPSIAALIFDFDGLIVDTEGPAFQAWQEIYREHGAELPLEEWGRRIGGGPALFNVLDFLEARAGRAVERERLRAESRRRQLELVAAQPVLPGVKEYLADARRLGLKLGVASSSPRDWVEGHLGRLGLLGSFDSLSCAEDVPRTKPDPALYLAALAAFGLSPLQAVALEDSPNGVLAARRAGIFCVAVPNPTTRELAFGHADLRLDSLADWPLSRLLEAAGKETPPGISLPGGVL